MVMLIVPNSTFNTEQIFNLNESSMIMYDFETETLTIQFPYETEFELFEFTELEYNELKQKLSSSIMYVIIHRAVINNYEY